MDEIQDMPFLNQTPDDNNNSMIPYTGEFLSLGARTAFIVISTAEILCGVPGNILFLTAMFTNRSLGKRNMHNLFLINLALSDLMTLGYWMPFFPLDLMMGHYPVANQIHCIANGFVVCFCGAMSLLSLTSISLNRYLHVCHARLYHQIFTPRRTIFSWISCWVASFIMALPPALTGSYYYRTDLHTCSFGRGNFTHYTQIVVVFLSGLPAFIIFYWNFKIFQYWKQTRQINKKSIVIENRDATNDTGNYLTNKTTTVIDSTDDESNDNSSHLPTISSELGRTQTTEFSSISNNELSESTQTLDSLRFQSDDRLSFSSSIQAEYEKCYLKVHGKPWKWKSASKSGEQRAGLGPLQVKTSPFPSVRKLISSVLDKRSSKRMSSLQNSRSDHLSYRSPIVTRRGHLPEVEARPSACRVTVDLAQQADDSLTSLHHRYPSMFSKNVQIPESLDPSGHLSNDDSEETEAKIHDADIKSEAALYQLSPQSNVTPAQNSQVSSVLKLSSKIDSVQTDIVQSPITDTCLPNIFHKHVEKIPRIFLNDRPLETTSSKTESENVSRNYYQKQARLRRQKKRAKEESVVRSLFVVCILMFLSYIPFAIVTGLDSYKPVNPAVNISVTLGFFLNNAVNWIVYGVMNRSYRKAYFELLSGLFRKCFVKKLFNGKKETLRQSTKGIPTEGRNKTEKQINYSSAENISKENMPNRDTSTASALEER